jgi:HEAT repeat protein
MVAVYTLTDAAGKQRQSQEVAPIVDFGLMVQTVKKEEREQRQEEKVKPFRVLEGLRKYADQQVLLVGRPGSGKSTALARLMLEMAAPLAPQVWGEPSQIAVQSPPELGSQCGLGVSPSRAPGVDLGGKIPVLVELRYWQGSIAQLILNSFARHELPLTAQQLETVLPQLLILFDGVNELPSEEARSQLSAFRRNHPKLPMIFTTRDLSLGGDLGIEQKLEMQPLTEAQMQAFIQAYVPEQAEAMLRQLRDRLREFGQTPLLLWMLCGLFQQTKKIPENLGLVFRLFTQGYERNLKQDVVIESNREWWKPVLQHLAWVMMQGEKPTELRVAIAREEAVRVIAQFLNGKVPYAEDFTRKCLRDLQKHHLIQAGTGNEELEFRHQLIQEYYAAEALLERLPTLSDAMLKQEYLNYLKWTEPVALMLALVDDEAQALRVVKLVLDVDRMLGARVAGEVQPAFQEKTVGLVNQLIVEENLPEWLKVELVGKTRSELSAPLLLQFLDDSRDINIVRTAAAFLGETNDQNVIDLLTKRLEDIDSQFSAQKTFRDSDPTGKIWTIHIEALACVSPQTAIQFLRRKLSVSRGFNTTISMFNGAPELLMKLDSKAMLPELISKLQAAQDNYQKSHILNLMEQARLDDSIISQLAQILATEEDELIRARIIKVIGKTNSELAIATLIELIAQPSPRLRHEACNQLIEGKIKQTSKLEMLLSHEDWNIACAAAVVLGSLGYEKALPLLSDAIQHHRPVEIRIAATKALGKINSPTSILYLRDALYDDEPYIRREAAFSLSKFDRREAIPELMLALRSGYLDARTNGIRSLARLKEEEPLWNILHKKVTGWQTAVVELVNLGRIEALPNLCQALVDIGGESANTIIHTLSKFADHKTINWLLDAIENTEQYASDSYFCNRVALVLSGCRYDVVEDKLSHLTSLLTRKYIEQLFWVIPAIQNRCNFYNYEIWQDAIQNEKLEIKNGEHETAVGQTTTIFKIETLNAPNAALNLGGIIHGDQSGTQSQ